MDQKNSVSKSLPVPKGRISRASSFGKIAIKFASSIVVGGTKELVGGRSPSIKNLLVQEKNILTFIILRRIIHISETPSLKSKYP